MVTYTNCNARLKSHGIPFKLQCYVHKNDRKFKYYKIVNCALFNIYQQLLQIGKQKKICLICAILYAIILIST